MFEFSVDRVGVVYRAWVSGVNQGAVPNDVVQVLTAGAARR